MPDQPYPFEKNRYFPRKRLRAADFEREQSFFEHKLDFLSHWLFGTGKAFGLGVQRVDSDSLLVEPGFAVDARGRWLVVDGPVICRVRALEGFDALSGETAVLRLAYREEPFDPMLLDSGEECCSGARERFALSLTEWVAEPSGGVEAALFSDSLLFEDGELRVCQRLPCVLSAERVTEARLYFECSASEPVEADLFYAPQVSGFAGGADGSPLRLSLHLRLPPGITPVAVPLYPAAAGQAALFTLDSDGFRLEKRGERFGVREALRLELPVVRGDPARALAVRLALLSPQELWPSAEDGLPLAGVRLLKSGEQCLLDAVFPLGGGQGVPIPCLQEGLRRCMEYFPQAAAAAPAPAPPPAPTPAPPPSARRMVTGVVELRAGLHCRKGDILRSEELAHGLGPGNVFIEFGPEEAAAAAVDGHTSLFLGDLSLFEEERAVAFDRAVRVWPEKGTFELAVRMRGEPRQSVLRLRWFAWQAEGKAPPPGKAGRLLRLRPDVAIVKPGETVGFSPVFADGQGAPCVFTVANRHGGSITRDGIYTAPGQPGLYQVRAQLSGRPEESTHAFVLVREEETSGPV